MKYLKQIFVIVVILMSFSGTTCAEETNIIITQDMLTQMSDIQRNSLFEGLKQIEKSSVSTEKVVEVINEFDVDNLEYKADKVANAIVIFCKKLGFAVKEFFSSPVGLVIITWFIIKTSILPITKIAMIILFLIFLVLLHKSKKIELVTKELDENKVLVIKKVTEDFVPCVNLYADSDNNSFYRIIASVVTLGTLATLIGTF